MIFFAVECQKFDRKFENFIKDHGKIGMISKYVCNLQYDFEVFQGLDLLFGYGIGSSVKS
jgi:hypothetical protein